MMFGNSIDVHGMRYVSHLALSTSGSLTGVEKISKNMVDCYILSDRQTRKSSEKTRFRLLRIYRHQRPDQSSYPNDSN